MTCWGLWESRNEVLHKGISKKSLEVVNKVQFLLEEFRIVKQEKDRPSTRGHPNSHWLAPNAGSVKVNFDAAIFKELGVIGVGVAIRDSCALYFALEVGLRNIIAEGDSSLTISAVKSSSLDHSNAGGIVEAIKFLSQSFNKKRK
ncbi:hypothetical protein REPUB_Repub05bG0058800 [Reevesia pubescens]